MNVEILPPEGETKHLGQLITFKNAVQVELEHHTKYAWAKFTSSPARVDVTKVPLWDTLKLFDANVAPSHLYATRTWTMMEELRKMLQTTQRRMTTTDVEHHDSDNEPVDDTTEHNNQDLNEQTTTTAPTKSKNTFQKTS